MSLIHDALKSMDASQEPAPAVIHAPVALARARPAWLDAMLAFTVVLGVGVVGWFLWKTQVPPKPTPSSMAAVPTPAPLSTAALPPAPQPLPTEAVQRNPMAAHATNVQPLAVIAQAVEPSAAPLSQAPPSPVGEVATPKVLVSASQSPVSPVVMQPVPQPALAKKPARSDKIIAPVASSPVVDNTPVELRFARFVTAMKDGRTTDAQNELAVLKQQLPAEALGLLRAQAWFDLRAGRDTSAADGYRAILERMPGDEEAAINLASIQSRQRKPEEARATLDAAARLQPDSVALRAALAQFTPMARP